METILTSNPDWLEIAVKEYSKKQKFKFIDDAKLGITEKDLISAVQLIRAAKKKTGATLSQITAVLVSLGLSAAGIYLVLLAIVDPEPTSKLGLLIGGGLIMAFTGGLSTLRALGLKFKVRAKTNIGEFEIDPK